MADRGAPGVMARGCIGAVRWYQRRLSFMTQGWCRFSPSCSEYAIQSLLRYGAFRGAGLAVWRILRCNPWGGCGHDPVPDRPSESAQRTKISR
jgi:putative membrane protein insertion efficiency factor